MKAVLLSLYMMTNAFGNLIDILIMVSISRYINNQVPELIPVAWIPTRLYHTQDLNARQ